MIFGNLLALPQRSVKRMLAYSSVAHAGYLLVGVVSASVAGAREKALAGILFYLAAYAATAIGAFAIVGALERRARLDDEPVDPWDLERFAGLARRRPALAFAMSVFLLSLARHPAHRRLRREALHLPGGRRSAALRPRDPGPPDERDGRLLLPPRGRLHVHACRPRGRARRSLPRPRCRSRSQRPWPSSCCSGSWRIRSYASRRRPAPSCCSPSWGLSAPVRAALRAVPAGARTFRRAGRRR